MLTPRTWHAMLALIFHLAACRTGDDLLDVRDGSAGDGDAQAPADGADGTPATGDGAPQDGAGDGGAGGDDGDSDGTASDGDDDPPLIPTLPDGRGATMPFVTYEAEDMATTGRVLGPSTQFGEVAAEASQRRAVRLERTGDQVSFQARMAAQGLVVRYSIPDGGQDYWTTLHVYVDGEPRAVLNLTSRFSWTYGGDDLFNRPEQEDPARGQAHHFFDETRAIVGDVPAGATVTIRKDEGDGAAHYDLDFVELEPVPRPVAMPAGALSATECGATPDDAGDDSDALQACIDRARGERRILYLPAGVFHSYTKPLSVAGVTVQGAGVWHTVVHGYYASFDCWGGHCIYRDFTLMGDTVRRLDDEPGSAFGGNGSDDSVLENVWIEHTKTGYWTGPETRSLTIRNTRFRNLFADGVNLYGGTSDSVVENCHARNTGDDAFAAWSHGIHPQNRNNVFRHNFAQLPWRANCFALYGGESTTLEDNVCADVVQYPGILLARQFDATPFTGMNRLTRNSLVRAGGYAYGQGQGALKLHADQGPIQNVWVDELDVVSPTFYGVHVQGTDLIDTVYLSHVTIHAPGQAGFFLNWGARGAMDVETSSLAASPRTVIDDSGGAFVLLYGSGNSGL